MTYEIGEIVWVFNPTISMIIEGKIKTSLLINRSEVYEIEPNNKDIKIQHSSLDFIFKDKLDALLRLKDHLNDKLAISNFEKMTAEESLEKVNKMIGELE